MDVNDIVLPLHLMSLGYVAWNIISADHLGLTWIRATRPTLPEALVRKYHKGTWIGLCLMIATGFTLFWPMREFLLTRPQFYIKMFFVLALVANGFMIGKFINIATTRTYASLTFKEKLPLLISGAVSTLGWLGAATMAFYLIPD